MAMITQTRNRFLLPAIVLLVLDAAALGFLFTPWGRPPEQREADYNRLRSEWQQKAISSLRERRHHCPSSVSLPAEDFGVGVGGM